MIKFFRNIRRRLLRENRFTRYLFYAIGEIILVVIGILIALQLNTWKQDRTHRIEEQFYLKKLRQNIAQDTSYLTVRINRIIKDLDHLKQLKIAEENPETIISKDSISGALVSLHRFTPQTSTFDNLIATGKLELIQNQSLVDSLFTYYNDLNNFTNQVNNSAATYTREHIGPYLLHLQGGIFNQNKAENDFAKDSFILNAADLKIFLGTSLLDLYKSNQTRANY